MLNPEAHLTPYPLFTRQNQLLRTAPSMTTRSSGKDTKLAPASYADGETEWEEHKDGLPTARGGRRPASLRMLWTRLSPWALPALLSLVLVLFTAPLTKSTGAVKPRGANAFQNLVADAEPPRKSDNYTDVVQWDNYTVFLNDQRMFL